MKLEPDLLSAIGSVVAAVVTSIALLIAVKAMRATRHAGLADPLLNALGDMLAALAEISDAALKLDKATGGKALSRERLSDPFRRFQVASARVGLLEPSLVRNHEYGEWLRAVANNLAADLLQSDESASFAYAELADLRLEDKPHGVTDEDWEILSKSISYWNVRMVGLDPPKKVPSGFVPLQQWWAPRIIECGLDGDSVYGIESTYLIQSARLLDDFVREYVQEWATHLVSRGLLR